MLDLSYFQNQNSNVQGFFNGGTWQTWIKPRGAKLVNILCVGSGGGGGGGLQSTVVPRGGGAGGGGGAITRLTINANLLPDILYILPGIGGAGGVGGITGVVSSGTAGQNSFVCLIPSTSSVSNVVLRSGTTPAVGGGAGSTVATGTAAGETINVIANNIFANLGNFTFQAGSAGGQGTTTNSASVSPGTFIISAGGGGGTSTGGGVINTSNIIFPGITATSVNTNGSDGIVLYKPTLILYGGRGGGGSLASGSGGNGGNGAPGSGGGGGGASFDTGVNAGNGGNGGNGFIIITTSI